MMSNGQDTFFYIVRLTFLLGPAKYKIKANSCVQEDEPPQYSPRPRRADRGHGTETRTLCFLHQLISYVKTPTL
jgi:hypothetical protein